MQKQSNIPLVLISDKGIRYSRYIGSKFDMTCVSNQVLSKEEIEMFRTNPKSLLGDEPEPEVA